MVNILKGISCGHNRNPRQTSEAQLSCTTVLTLFTATVAGITVQKLLDVAKVIWSWSTVAQPVLTSENTANETMFPINLTIMEKKNGFFSPQIVN